MSNHIIETDRHGLWIAVAFTLALLGIVLGLVSLHRVSQITHFSQMQVLALNKRIVALEKAAAPVAAPAPATVEAAPAAQ